MDKLKQLFLIISLGALLIFSVNYAYKEPVNQVSAKNNLILASSGKSDMQKDLISNRNKERTDSIRLILLKQHIEKYLGKNERRLGLVYYDFNSEGTFEINGDKIFNAASTVKVPLNMVYYNLAFENKINLSDKLAYSKSDYEDGTGIMLNFKKIYLTEIQTLLDYSIKYSDNIATNMLIRNIGHNNMKQHFEEMAGDVVNHHSNMTTPEEMIKYLKILYFNPDNNPYYLHLLDVMKETCFHDRLDKYIPELLTAHKIGNYCMIIKGKAYDYVNDIGIVFTDNPYALAIYTENMKDANEIIAQISKMVYDYQIDR